MIPQLSPRAEVIASILLYSACSGSLVLINKLTVHYLPFPSLVITFQLIASCLFIAVGTATKMIECDPLKWEYILPYLAYTIAFSIGVYCNMKSLQSSNVETVIVFRALTPCLVSILDVMFLGREYPSNRSWAGLSLIALGAYGYALVDPEFQSQGTNAYFWPFLYLFAISFVMAYGKKIIKSVDLKTRSGPVLYTNLLGWPPMLIFAHLGDEYRKASDAFDTNNAVPVFTAGSLTLLLAGCVVGTAIGYTSWWCRDKISATSFTLIGVMNKCLTILANLLIWDNHASPMGIASLFLCLIGGSIYQQAPLRRTKSEEHTLPDKESSTWTADIQATSMHGDDDTESGTTPQKRGDQTHRR